MRSETFDFPRAGGEIQRIQCVQWDSWEDLDFVRPEPEPRGFEELCGLYRNHFVKPYPWIFGQMILFQLPPRARRQGDYTSKALGRFCDSLAGCAQILRTGVTVKGGQPVFHNSRAKDLYLRLAQDGCLQLVCGKAPYTKVIPFGGLPGKLSGCAAGEAGTQAAEPGTSACAAGEAAPELVSSAGFFLMDCFDIATPYDAVGTPFGLAVQNGQVLRPPLFGREALIVRRTEADRIRPAGKEDGVPEADHAAQLRWSVTVETPALEDLEIETCGRTFVPGVNARIFSRPAYAKTPRGSGTDIVIIGTQVKAVRRAGGTMVPASGFVLRTEEERGAAWAGQLKSAGPADRSGAAVTYHGMEDVVFGIQCGNSTVRGGEPVMEFTSPFYHIRRPWETPFPPCLYPTDHQKARAARVALGADEQGRPMLLWAEGAAKPGHEPGQDSCGASLSELALLCAELGMENGVNLDGGGSAQILLHGERSLSMTVRTGPEKTPVERAVPEGLAVREAGK